MKAILVDKGGFKKEVYVDEVKPTYVLVFPITPVWGEMNESIVVTSVKKTFYFERDFIDEDDNQVLVYISK